MRLLFLLVASALGSCATVNGGEGGVPVLYGCSDLVVVGRIATTSGSSIPDDDALLPNWQNRWQLQVQIRRVIRGFEMRRVVPATAISHAQIRDDRDFLVVLGPDVGAGYELKEAALWRDKPRPELAPSCA